MAKAKKKTASPKKARPYFFRNKEVVAHKKKLKALQKERKDILQKLKSIIEAYNDGAIEVEDTADLFERLPIESLKELYAFVSGEKLDYNLFFMKLRQKLRKDHNSSVETLQKVERRIHESKLDVLLSKINCVQKKLDAGN
jgi:hypothetical protein